jgi:holo-[acyl-carrier protein] synthase
LRIAGTGVDIVEIARIAAVAERYGARFIDRVFTPAETDHCRARGVPEQHLAGRFAAKEAALKALGTGWIGGIRWRDVEIETTPSGEPRLVLHGGAAERARELGIVTMHVSIAHTRHLAIAHAIAEAGDT